MEMETVSTRYV